jgi:hypothetical protein
VSPTHAGRRRADTTVNLEGRTIAVFISKHVCERFIERCRPGLDDAAAYRELCRLLPRATVDRERPSRLNRSSTATFAYVEIADVVFALQQARNGNASVLTTAMTPPIRAAKSRQTARRRRRNIKRVERDEARRERRFRQRRRSRQSRHARTPRSGRS